MVSTPPSHIPSTNSTLRSSLSQSISTASSATVFRSDSQPDKIRSLADRTLHSSSARSVSASSASSVSSVSTTPPPSTPTSPYSPRIQVDPLSLNREKTRLSIASSSPSSSESSNVPFRLILNTESSFRLRQLQRELEQAKARAPKHDTKDVFKAATSIDLLFLIGATGCYIDAAKKQVNSIMDEIKKTILNESEVRVAVVGYKDHRDSPNIQFLDFTPDADIVRRFLCTLVTTGGGDAPDVFGGIHQAVKASWKQQTRCIVHIADEPGHTHALHDLPASFDNYFQSGSEPHSLTYEQLLKQLIQLNINYALLRNNSRTDRIALDLSRAYAAAGADVKLLPSNLYHSQVKTAEATISSREASRPRARTGAELQFEELEIKELEIGTTYRPAAMKRFARQVKSGPTVVVSRSKQADLRLLKVQQRRHDLLQNYVIQLQHLVVRTVTAAVIRTANRLSSPSSGTSKDKTFAAKDLAANRVDKDSGGDATDVVSLETVPSQWENPGWLDETMEVEGLCPDVVVYDASTLNKMMELDENIKLGFIQLTVHARSKPFAKGSRSTTSYARTPASTSRFVIKSFLEDGHRLAHLVEGMRIQALGKAFALEFNDLSKIRNFGFVFNGLWKTEPPLDFVVTSCIQNKSSVASGSEFRSLEPYIPGEHIRYNNNAVFAKEDGPDDQFRQVAQAFSHFTFERSRGHFLVNNLQGVGHLLTDPSIHTLDKTRFPLNETNLNEDGFKLFFAAHKCNSICHTLGLKTNREMIISGHYQFRELWPTMDLTICCSNIFCRRIIRLVCAYRSYKFPGHHWCNACWPQLESTIAPSICVAPGPYHEFDVSRFFHESQGQGRSRRCPKHM